jgi:hypothetical protein
MKKLLLVAACASLLACAGVQEKPSSYDCATPKAEEIIAYTEKDYEQIMMYHYGGAVGNNIKEGKFGKENTVNLNLFYEQHNESLIGEIWVEKREDGHYLCMTGVFCDLESKITSTQFACDRLGVK